MSVDSATDQRPHVDDLRTDEVGPAAIKVLIEDTYPPMV